MGAITATRPPDGLRSLVEKYDVYIPRFEVFVGPRESTSETASEAELIGVKDVLGQELDRIERQIARPTSEENQAESATFVPLAGPLDSEKPETRVVRSVSFTESVGPEAELSQVQLEIHNVYDPQRQRYEYTDTVGDAPPLLDYGKVIVLRIGYRDGVETVFEGIIVQITADFPADGEPTVSVTAVDKREKLRAARPENREAFREHTVEEVAARLVALGHLRLGEGTERAPLGGRVRVPRDQDLSEFLVDLARRGARELSAFGNAVLMLKPGDEAEPVLTYRYREGLISFSPVFNATGCPVEVDVRARTPNGTRIRGHADIDDLQREGMVPPATAGESALQELESAGRPRRERVERVSNLVFENASEANQYARALLKYHLDRLLTASGELMGDPRVRAGRSIAIEGVGRYNGCYYLTSVVHSIGDSGYQTSFDARRNTRLTAQESSSASEQSEPASTNAGNGATAEAAP
ncbi:MAG: hypothetical protein AAGF12_09345 [Myxococcota bacterium]